MAAGAPASIQAREGTREGAILPQNSVAGEGSNTVGAARVQGVSNFFIIFFNVLFFAFFKLFLSSLDMVWRKRI